jgi:proteasome accessory factor A
MRFLFGLDTEYGLLIEGRTADSQVEDSMALVRAYAGQGHLGWNYRYESPRTDLRGFNLKHLAQDPEDAKFDRGRTYGAPDEVRADRVLPNGARFYNDHGHPEYATPECASLRDLVCHDAVGDLVVRRAAAALEASSDVRVTIYKNNSDFHGASWGSHESYAAPRSLGFEALFAALAPMMVVRPVLVGAGKVGAESGDSCFYQLSQRADFFVEPANAETLFRRPIFNTRDEPHAQRASHIRVHVICGDSNMIPSATARKVGLLRLAVRLASEGSAPVWKLKDAVRAAKAISRDDTYEFRIELEGKSWTTAYEVFESYFSAAEATLELDDEDRWTIDSSRKLLNELRSDWSEFRRHVDWAAKRAMLEQFMAEAGLNWHDPSLRAYDMEYHNLDPDVSLHGALVEMGQVDAALECEKIEPYLQSSQGDTRAFPRGVAVAKFGQNLTGVCWRSLSFRLADEEIEVELSPDKFYPPELANTESVEEFIEMMRRIQ